MKYIKFFVVFVAVLIMFYLIGSFIAADFNITTWEPALRGVLAIFVTFISCCIAVLIADADTLWL